MHPWHDIQFNDSTLETFPAVIEVPQGTKNKYELDKETGFLKLDRVLFLAMHFPANYGFVPQTLADDGDPLDVLVLSQEAVTPLAFLQARAIGGFHMEDDGGVDNKVICVHVNDPAFSDYNSTEELPRHIMVEILRFFEDYKTLQYKRTAVGVPCSREESLEWVRVAAEQYKKKYKK